MIKIEDAKFKHPFTMTIAGPSQCGKTHLVGNILKNFSDLITPTPTKILYCYSEAQDQFHDLQQTIPSMEFHRGLIENFEDLNNVLLILDDLMTECIRDEQTLNLFTKGSHHRNISVIFLIQNIFPNGKYARTISLNSHYLIIFNNHRDKLQISNVARQLYPKETHYFKEAFDDAVSSPYGYIIVDLKPDTDNCMRLKTYDFLNDYCCVYTKK